VSPFKGILIAMPVLGDIADYLNDKKYRNRQTHYVKDHNLPFLNLLKI